MNEDKTTETNGPGQTSTQEPIAPADLEKLRKQAAERDQYLDMLQRSRAEFENYQKRSKKELEQERRYAVGTLARDLLPVIDNLERALHAAEHVGEKGPLVEGVSMVQNQFLELLKRHGISRIEAQGKPFDPNIHQAVMQKASDEVEANTVLQVLEQGFMNHDRVLRPAKVIVSTKAS